VSGSDDAPAAGELLREAITRIPLGLAVWRLDGEHGRPEDLILAFINSVGATPSGKDPQELINLPMSEALPELMGTELEAVIWNSLRERRPHEVVITVKSDGEHLSAFRNVVTPVHSSAVVATFTDISREHRLEREYRVERRSGLASRAYFDEVLLQATQQHNTEASPLAIVFIDLDGFKAINDTYGHIVGDEAITAMAGRLTQMTPVPELISRWGGDEFAILVVDGREAEVAEQALAAMERDWQHGGEPLHVGASVGVVAAAATPTSPRELLRLADEAMYQAKRAGGGVIVHLGCGTARD
jgi:diguanylate cyclase (GGDEF)-like protein